MNMAPARGDNPATGWQPHGGAVTGALVRGLDWSATAIGPMVSYAQSARCRWKLLLDYFGDDTAGIERCGVCDNCKSPPTIDSVR